MRPLFALLVALALVAGCDSDSEEVLTFLGVEVEQRGDATVTVENGALVVSGLGPGRAGGFTIPGTASRVDVEIDGLTVPQGAQFGIEVESLSGSPIASFFNVGGPNGQVDFVFDFPSVAGLTAALVLYKLGGENGQIVYEAVLDIGQNRSVARRIPSGAGSGSGKTGSTHVIREGGRYIVVSDSDASAARSGCSGFTVTPPPTVDDPQPRAYCTDWIEVEPLLEATTMPEGRVAVTGASVGGFTVRELRKR